MLDTRLGHVIAVVQTGSFTKAAEQVGITQSGITRSVADLERELGYAIFYRTSRGVLLTENGRDFFERARRLLEDAQTLLRGRAEKSDPYAGALRIGVSPAAIEWLLAEPLAELVRRHPSVKLDVVGGTFERMIQLLRNGGVDVALGAEEAFKEWLDIKIERITAIAACPFVRHGHPLLEIPEVNASQLVQYDFLVPSESRPHTPAIRALFTDQAVDWTKRLHFVDSYTIVKAVVSRTDAIGVVEAGLTRTSTFQTEFASLPGFNPYPVASVCCAVRSRHEPKASVKALLRTMRSYHADMTSRNTSA